MLNVYFFYRIIYVNTKTNTKKYKNKYAHLIIINPRYTYM